MDFVPVKEEEVGKYPQVSVFVLNLSLLLGCLSLLSAVITRLGSF